MLQLLAAARIGAPGAVDQLLAEAERGALPADAPAGTGLLVFLCGSAPCAAALGLLREVLPMLPQFASLPASPPWMLGVFALRTEMLALVDPAPILLGMDPGDLYVPLLTTRHPYSDSAFPAPPTGPLGLTMAIVAGEGERALGLAVSAIGDLVRADDDELVTDATTLTRAASPIAERYIAGIYTPRGTTDHYAILHIERLVEDLLRALEPEEERRGSAQAR
jgi:chemotaxis signal transduction protein